LQERLIPLSAEHFAAAAAWQERVKGRTIVDVAFAQQAHHSVEFLDAARGGAAAADVVVFSHPWVYPLVRDQLRRDSQLVVYDAQNVEGLLRAMLLDDGGFGTELVREVLRMEHDLCAEADLILACSHADRTVFNELYSVPHQKILVVPNGTFTNQDPADDERRHAAKRALGFGDNPLALFLGSAYQPNIEAADFIVRHLAPTVPEVGFVICGGVGAALPPDVAPPPNVRVTGQLGAEEKAAYVAAADLAVNPMFSGSGTAVKMFDFMSARLPIVTSPVGARGIADGGEPPFVVAAPEQFAAAIRRMIADRAHADALGAAAREMAVEQYSWERISRNLGLRLHRARLRLGQSAPFFSIVVPSYERPDSLAELMACLEQQTFRDFEVIVVDQSRSAWREADRCASLDLLYVHTDVRGAVGARNLGAFHARGDVVAFTDDDCRPLPDWLANARRYFDDPEVVGVEGLITSEHRDDPDYRAVTNAGFEGIGFMTANLLIRRETFMAIDGFDTRFDRPHFREDTDLGWRAGALGRIPFGHDVRVYHPPHRRTVEREGHAERMRFFEKDALLLKKHPERYRALFLTEGHYAKTTGFHEHFLRGAEKYGVALDDFYVSLLSGQRGGTAVGAR
jgi:glycosyltransferase involved in cell wall biosynthesis/GT2 family glycosyltransferase